MYRDRAVLCFILARGGSKGLQRKNTLMIGGKPLIAHTIDIAHQVKYIDKVFVSTEDKEIKEIARKHNAAVIDRPMELAVDTANYLDAVKHMITQITSSDKNPIVVILEPTFPIRKVEHVEKCIEMYESNIDVVASISKVKTHPSHMFKIKDNLLQSYLKIPFVSNRQQAEPLFAINGSIIVSGCNFLKNQETIFEGRMKGFLLDDKHSLDIDTQFDFQLCKFMLESNDIQL